MSSGMKGTGREARRDKSVGLWAGTLHSNSQPTNQPFIKALVVWASRGGLAMLPPCGQFSELQPGTQGWRALAHSQGVFRGCQCHLPEKAMAPHSSTLAWRIPWTEEPGRLQSTRSLGVGHDWATSLSLFTFVHWRRKWQPTPVFLPGESQGRGSPMGCRLWGRTESDTTEVT